MNNLIDKVRRQLPLHVRDISWDGDNFVILGEDWRFSTSCVWRVLNEGQIKYACWDEKSEILIKEMVGEKIVSLDIQCERINVDPVFIMSGNKIVEIFSCSSLEPWEMQFLNGEIYIGNS
ncbi:hypothetical protein J4E05_16655 [Thalassospira sp. NFXS8]|uniref:hypothetical protein n=1 Tax=Thalassospira sp. NFXS8 TaxID=2819093 RepID=UPI0032DFAA2C